MEPDESIYNVGRIIELETSAHERHQARYTNAYQITNKNKTPGTFTIKNIHSKKFFTIHQSQIEGKYELWLL